MKRRQSLWSTLTNQSPKLFWPEVIASFALALLPSAILYLLTFRDLTYSQFTAGYSTWLSIGKNGDFGAVLTFIASSPMAFLLLVLLKTEMGNRFGTKAAEEFSESIKWSLIPFGFWSITLLVSSEFGIFFPAVGYSLMLSSVLLSSYFLLRYRRNNKIRDAPFISAWSALWGVLIAVVASAAGFLTLFSRLDSPKFEPFGVQTLIFMLLVTVFALGVSVRTADSEFRKSISELKLKLRIRQLSLGVPLLMTVLIPERLASSGSTQPIIQVQPTLIFSLTIMMIVVAVSILAPDQINAGAKTIRISRSFRVLQILPLLVFLKTPNSELPKVSNDDYHVGEFTLPGHLLTDSSLFLYDNYDPPRGFVNFLPGIVSKFFSTARTVTTNLLFLLFTRLSCFWCSQHCQDCFPLRFCLWV